MFKKSTLVLFAVAALACTSFAQDHPNFAGTWKLNSSKSNVGDYGPSVRTDVIIQDGSKFTDKVTSTTQMGESDYTLPFTADGNKVVIAPNSPAANMGMLTLEDVTAVWNGATVAVTTDSSYQGQMEIASKAVYSLSQDGKTLTITNHVSMSMGDFDTTLVFDKQ
jgi:TPP-dependent 2-oxoacid decarboxylase